ncbi:MAG TPA: hypothetical protein VGW33_14065 [Terriglobia bacterium]|nr:hypothetical protein [Terriglobia bacterium]
MAGACLLIAAPVVAQGPPGLSAPQVASLADALRTLQTQVQQLNVALQDVKSEAAQSRAESAELRRELAETRQQLSTFKRELDRARPAQVESAVAAGAVGTGAAGNGADAGGQSSESQAAATDQRLSNLEEEQQLLNGKVDTQYQTKVESGSKYRVRLSGLALINAFSDRGAVNSADVPFLAQARSAGDTNGTFGATLRQSLVGLDVFGPDVAGARTSAQVQFDFFGGFPSSPDGIAAGIVRLRTATARFDWPKTSVVAGQDAPFFSPLSPTSLASLGYPAFAYAGNLWTWTPQIRLEHRMDLPGDSSLLVQGGILDPLTGEPPYDPFYLLPQAGQRSGQPAYAARLAWTGNMLGRPFTVGGGGYYARQNWGFGRIVDAWAGTADWSLPISRWFSLTGELYRGRALGGLGGGEGRSVLYSGALADPTTQVIGLNAAGGWSQLKFTPTEKLEFNGAFGEDYPFASDLRRFPAAQSYFDATTGRNESALVNGIYHLRSNLLFSLEYRRLWTSDLYAPRVTANQTNLGVGVLF